MRSISSRSCSPAFDLRTRVVKTGREAQECAQSFSIVTFQWYFFWYLLFQSSFQFLFQSLVQAFSFSLFFKDWLSHRAGE